MNSFCPGVTWETAEILSFAFGDLNKTHPVGPPMGPILRNVLCSAELAHKGKSGLGKNSPWDSIWPTFTLSGDLENLKIWIYIKMVADFQCPPVSSIVWSKWKYALEENTIILELKLFLQKNFEHSIQWLIRNDLTH